MKSVHEEAGSLKERMSVIYYRCVRCSHWKHFISLWKNITEKIRGEEERKGMQKQILQMQKMEAIGTLAGGIAHDFNNILSIIMGYTDLALITLVGTGEKLKVHRYLEEINHTVERGASLTKQLLLFSRKQSYQPIFLNLNDIIKELFRMLQRILGEDIEILVDLHPSLWAVFADKSNMEQTIINLAINSRDAMPQGGKIFLKTQNIAFEPERLSPSSEGHPGQFVCLSVQDWGRGISPDILPHIFEPFYTTKEKGKGTGLGLSVVYGIVKQHGGSIEVHSETGKGASFDIFLPGILKEIKEKKKTQKPFDHWRGEGKRRVSSGDIECCSSRWERAGTGRGILVPEGGLEAPSGQWLC